MQTLADRQKAYEQNYDIRIVRRIPIIIRTNCRLFPKLTRRLPKPYCSRMVELMSHTMINMAKQIDGSVFGYQQGEEIILILRNNQTNDTDPWFANRVQKMASVAASIATYQFNRYHWTMTDPPELSGAATFSAHVFAVPDVTEAINYLLSRQQEGYNAAVNSALRTELRKQVKHKQMLDLIESKGIQERLDILLNDCGIDFETYPSAFRKGIGVYLAPKTFETPRGTITKNKWVIDVDLPLFTEEQGKKFVYGLYWG
jgi:tRNA(His) guanylyltransferase